MWFNKLKGLAGYSARDEIRTSALFQLVICRVRRLLAGLLEGTQQYRNVNGTRGTGKYIPAPHKGYSKAKFH
jgi:hypothetical protein